ncbi:YqhA family protein [Parasynechococcus sp.]|jgi:uncharacterized membrane protein YqhA|uniref:YqhA family protein n=1 Tax=Parasynechococcus sp. TaxID=3101203 RepID=UPI003703FC52
MGTTRQSRLEVRFERLIWRFRLVTIVPVVMSLVGSVSCFIVGTHEELAAIGKVLSGEIKRGNANLVISKVVGGIDFYLIGIALLIFGYGIYELVISDIDDRLQAQSEHRQNLLKIESLDSLKQKLTKVIVVALIVTAFKLLTSFEINNITEVLQFCTCVLMLALSGWLIGRKQS